MSIELEFTPDLIAGQMVMAGFEGKTLPADAAAALAAGRLSGVTLFGPNLGAPDEVRELTDAIRRAATIPPFIAVDQEGGRVARLKAPFTVWPPPRALGVKNDAGLARETARAMAAELLAAGFNLNLAPVLDVDSNPQNPVIGDRSLGPDPGRVARLGAAMIEGFNQAGLISCAKHFPGHGDTALDSHVGLPTVLADRTTLDRRELVPFAAAIKARVPAIMTGHLQVPALDPYYPASISPAISTDLLRLELGFDGLIITDDLEMAALADQMPIADAAFLAVRAGADLLLVCSSPDRAEAARAAIATAIRHGALDSPRLFAVAKRILALKEKFLLHPPPDRSELHALLARDDARRLARKLEA